LRDAALDIIEWAIRASDPYVATRKLVRREGDRLCVGALEYDLLEWKDIYVIGAGKATQGIALALEEMLGDRLTDGLVVLKQGEPRRLHRIGTVEAAHPIPDENSYAGARQMVEIAHRAGERDLVFAAITGGSSALLVWPPEGISLTDKQALNRTLLDCGASIREINAVRKHVSRIKGGRLAEAIFPAELINLTVSDVIGDALDYITDPTVPDTSTHADAWRVLDKYELWDQIPGSVCRHLRCGPEVESPKAFSHRYHSFVVVPGEAACFGAAQRGKELGYPAWILTAEMDGESCEQAMRFVEAAERIGSPCVVIASGETVVTLGGEKGRGGPNQEFALSAALAIAGLSDVVVAAVDTDGTDGPTDASGGLVDGETVLRAREAGLDARACLEGHAALDGLQASGDAILTGPTGTNVNDVMLAIYH
jgi:glycerate 2-kinase